MLYNIDLSKETMEKICKISQSNIKAMESILDTYKQSEKLGVIKEKPEEEQKRIYGKIEEIKRSISDSNEVYEFFNKLFSNN